MNQHRDVLSPSFCLLRLVMADSGICCAILSGKYGVVPKEAMPETVSSSATREMTSALTRKLREDACRLRKAYADGSTLDELRQKKEANDGRNLSRFMHLPWRTSKDF